MKNQFADDFDPTFWNGNSPQKRKLEQIETARKRWNESEWVLRKLRCRSSTEPRRLNDAQLMEWHQRITSAPLC